MTIQPSEFVCLFGPSGIGKTTLLNIIAGLDRDYAGCVMLPAGMRLGVVFQEPRLLPWRSVRANVCLPIASEPALLARVDALLAAVGLEEFAAAYPERLSLGMKRRVALARAFAVEPGLLLLDEPFASLDAGLARRLRGLVAAVWRARPTAVLLVTHSLHDAVELADRILFLSPRPARLVHEAVIDLPRPREADPAAVAEQVRALESLIPGFSTPADAAP